MSHDDTIAQAADFPDIDPVPPTVVVEEKVEPAVETKPTEEKLKQNIGTNTEIFRARPETPDKGSLYKLSLPSITAAQIKITAESLPPMNLSTSDAQKEWYLAYRDSRDYELKGDVLDASLRRPGTLWTNGPEIGGKRYTDGTPPRKQTGGGVFVGDEALSRLTSYLDLGDTFMGAMWHSGWWATFRPPGEDARIELNRLMAADKIELGRQTYGQIFSNLTVYTVGRVLKMACDHLYSVSFAVENMASQTILKYLAIQDIHVFIWAFICTTYPDGFDYNRACMNDPTKCNHIEHGRVEVRGMHRTSISELTDWQRQHMTYRSPRSRTVEQVLQYQEEMKTMNKRTIRIRGNEEDGLFVTLKSPSALEHIEAGQRWIAGIAEMIEDGIADKEDDEERNAAIAAHGRASQLLQYIHWVESIQFGQMGSSIIEDQATVQHSLAQMTADDDVRENFFAEVKRYIADSVISLIGIPVYNCPICKKPQDDDVVNDRFPEIIPLDMIQCFFELHNQAMDRIMKRLL